MSNFTVFDVPFPGEAEQRVIVSMDTKNKSGTPVFIVEPIESTSLNQIN